MALDLGSKTIGLAIADTGHQIATPFDTIRRKKFSLDAAQLADIIAQRDIGGLVVGLPLNMDGSQGPRVQATRAFIRNLAQLDNFPPCRFCCGMSACPLPRSSALCWPPIPAAPNAPR